MFIPFSVTQSARYVFYYRYCYVSKAKIEYLPKIYIFMNMFPRISSNSSLHFPDTYEDWSVSLIHFE